MEPAPAINVLAANIAAVLPSLLRGKHARALAESVVNGNVLLDGDSLIRFVLKTHRRSDGLEHLPTLSSPVPLLSLIAAIEDVLSAFHVAEPTGISAFFSKTFENPTAFADNVCAVGYRSIRAAVQLHLSAVGVSVHVVPHALSDEFAVLLRDIAPRAVALELDTSHFASATHNNSDIAAAVTFYATLCGAHPTNVILLEAGEVTELCSRYPIATMVDAELVTLPTSMQHTSSSAGNPFKQAIGMLQEMNAPAVGGATVPAGQHIAILKSAVSEKCSPLSCEAAARQLIAAPSAHSADIEAVAVPALLKNANYSESFPLLVSSCSASAVMKAAGDLSTADANLLKDVLQVFLLHAALIPALPLRFRAFTDAAWEDVDALLSDFTLHLVDNALTTTMNHMKKEAPAFGFCQIHDHRLLRLLFALRRRGVKSGQSFEHLCKSFGPVIADRVASCIAVALGDSASAHADPAWAPLFNAAGAASAPATRSVGASRVSATLPAIEALMPTDLSSRYVDPLPQDIVAPIIAQLLIANNDLEADQELLLRTVDRYDTIVGMYDSEKVPDHWKFRGWSIERYQQYQKQKSGATLTLNLNSLFGQSFTKVKIRYQEHAAIKGEKGKRAGDYIATFCDEHGKDLGTADVPSADAMEEEAADVKAKKKVSGTARQLALNSRFDGCEKQLNDFELQYARLKTDKAYERLRNTELPTIAIPDEADIREVHPADSDGFRKGVTRRRELLHRLRNLQQPMAQTKVMLGLQAWRRVYETMRAQPPQVGEIRHPEAIAAFNLWKAVLEALNTLWPSLVTSINSGAATAGAPDIAIEPEFYKSMITACYELGFADVLGDALLTVARLPEALHHNMLVTRNALVPVSREHLRFVAERPGMRRGTCSVAEFYLALVGPHLPRPIGVRRDRLNRVQFSPDLWQVQLLDAVDAGKSACVIAPTSAGKTFIAHYLVRKTLMDSDEGFLVYVAPIDALMNQFCLEVDSLYAKDYKNADSHLQVAGRFSSDERSTSELASQILTTVPGSFETLLTAISNRGWADKIKAIVFDEIHNMFDLSSAQAAAWERLLLTTKAQFIALSATVGESSQFGEWLAALERRRRGADFVFIRHTERYNDLAPFVWSLPESRASSFDALTALHPLLGCSPALIPDLPWLPIELIRNDPAEDPVEFRSAKFDFSLLPEHAVQLYKVLHQSVSSAGDSLATIRSTLARLAPDVFFQACEVVPLRVARRYGLALIGLLRQMYTIDRAAAANIIRQLVGPSEGTARAVDAEIDADSAGGRADMFYFRHILHLINDLDVSARLPAILFHLDANRCARLQRHIVTRLYIKENIYKRNHRWWEKRCEALEAAELRLEVIEKTREKRKLQPPEEEEYLALKSERRKLMSMTEDDMLPIFMIGRTSEDFATDHRPIDQDKMARALKMNVKAVPRLVNQELKSLKEDIALLRTKVLARRGVAADEPAGVEWEEILEVLEQEAGMVAVSEGEEGKSADALYILGFMRGVGVHHDNLSRKLKDATETLFRLKELSVVIATETLGQGINMPCRSVGFIGSSSQLSALSYRQMSGRAGRRGFDKRGDVIFFGVRSNYIQQLFLSRLSPPKTAWPVNPVSLLRLYADPRESAAGAITRFFDSSFTTNQSPQLRDLLFLHGHFLAKHFTKYGYVDAAGRPRGLASLPLYLGDAQSPIFVLDLLVRSGTLYQVLNEPLRQADLDAIQTGKYPEVAFKSAALTTGQLRSIDADVKLLEVIATLIHEDSERGGALSVGRLPQSVRSVINSYNQDVLSSFSTYLNAFATHTASASKALPFSGLEFACDPSADAAVPEQLASAVLPKSLRSPFEALRGLGGAQDATTFAELFDSIPSSWGLRAAHLPIVIDEHGGVCDDMVKFYTQATMTDRSKFPVFERFRLTLRGLASAVGRLFLHAHQSLRKIAALTDDDMLILSGAPDPVEETAASKAAVSATAAAQSVTAAPAAADDGLEDWEREDFVTAFDIEPVVNVPSASAAAEEDATASQAKQAAQKEKEAARAKYRIERLRQLQQLAITVESRDEARRKLASQRPLGADLVLDSEGLISDFADGAEKEMDETADVESDEEVEMESAATADTSLATVVTVKKESAFIGFTSRDELTAARAYREYTTELCAFLRDVANRKHMITPDEEQYFIVVLALRGLSRRYNRMFRYHKAKLEKRRK